MKPKKYVIAGTAGSGKTTVIKELKKRGYYTVPEVAELIEKEALKKGERPKLTAEFGPKNTLSKKQRREFQKKCWEKQLEIEEKAEKETKGPIFLDGGLPDNIDIYEFFVGDKPPKEWFSLCKKHKYDKVFFLEPLTSYEQKGRWLTSEEAGRFKTAAIYERLGYKVIKVPVKPVEERVDFILKKIKEK